MDVSRFQARLAAATASLLDVAEEFESLGREARGSVEDPERRPDAYDHLRGVLESLRYAGVAAQRASDAAERIGL